MFLFLIENLFCSIIEQLRQVPVAWGRWQVIQIVIHSFMNRFGGKVGEP
jgi:ABC-type anion transport system duplicated permease subunit